ncbi:hypothetical protein ACQ4PT_053477 [Festuca glaucescens]
MEICLFLLSICTNWATGVAQNTRWAFVEAGGSPFPKAEVRFVSLRSVDGQLFSLSAKSTLKKRQRQRHRQPTMHSDGERKRGRTGGTAKVREETSELRQCLDCRRVESAFDIYPRDADMMDLSKETVPDSELEENSDYIISDAKMDLLGSQGDKAATGKEQGIDEQRSQGGGVKLSKNPSSAVEALDVIKKLEEAGSNIFGASRKSREVAETSKGGDVESDFDSVEGSGGENDEIDVDELNECIKGLAGIMGEQEKKDFLVETIKDNHVRFAGLQETKMRNVSVNVLNSFSGNRSFSWVVAASNGQSGGMLMGVDNDFFEVVESEIARSLGIEFPYDHHALQGIYANRGVKLKMIPKDVMHSIPTSLLYSLEGMPGLDWQKLLKLQSGDGSFLYSPSATAYALMQTGDRKCLEYINRIVNKFTGGGKRCISLH